MKARTRSSYAAASNSQSASLGLLAITALITLSKMAKSSSPGASEISCTPTSSHGKRAVLVHLAMKNSDTAYPLVPCHISVTRWALLSLLVSCTPILAQTVWTDGTGNWFTPANWSAGVPNSSTIAEINNGGTAQVTSSGAAASQVEIGVGAGDAGTLSISGAGSLQDEGAMYIGEDGSGSLSITAGATVSSSLFALGQNSGSSGTATVSGSGSTWTNLVFCFVGQDGNGTLNITNGGSVSDEVQWAISLAYATRQANSIQAAKQVLLKQSRSFQKSRR